MSLHEGEFSIDDALVTDLIATQMPQWTHLPIARIESAGTVNIIYRLGEDKVIRLPRSPDFSDGPEHERRWMQLFAFRVPLRVPRHHAIGRPTDRYPSPWSVLDWIEGTTADHTSLSDLDEAATDLGRFVVALQSVPTDGAPATGNYRGFGLANVDRTFRIYARKLADDIDQAAVIDRWDACLAAPLWAGPPTWFHSDLRGDNLIVDDGRLVAVIDWEGCTVGDPCADYLAAWWLFDDVSRPTFRQACQADPSDWLRAMGWALHMAVLAIPYYAESNPVFADQARRALAEVLADNSLGSPGERR